MKGVQYFPIVVFGAVVVGSLPAVASEVVSVPSELFQKLDRNQDGKITVDEVSNDQQRYFDRLIRNGDRDGNGELTKSEFLKAVEPPALPNQNEPGRRGPQPRFDSRRLFDNFDRNKDGKLTLDEVPEQARRMVQSILDRLGKKALTQDEFSRYAARQQGSRTRSDSQTGGANRVNPAAEKRAKEFFDRLDTNGDGKISVAESPERSRRLVAAILKRAGRAENASLSEQEFVRVFARSSGQPRRGSDSNPPNGNGQPGRFGRSRSAGGDSFGGPMFFRRLDTNRDGRLSKSELSRAADYFDELDGNKDGALDPRELFGPPPDGRESQRRPSNRPPRSPQDRPGDGA